jgi:putative transposase
MATQGCDRSADSGRLQEAGGHDRRERFAEAVDEGAAGRALQTELTGRLGYEKHDPAGHKSGNSRNGTSRKKLKGDFGEMELETPRDRNGSFEPKIVERRQTRWTGFDDKILSMYSRGMSTREIQGHLEEIYKVEVSPALI